MPDGFGVKETIAHPPRDVWAYLTDFRNAKEWMRGIEGMTQTTQGPLKIGTTFRFKARGKEHETRVTAFEPGKRIAVTSTQGGVAKRDQ